MLPKHKYYKNDMIAYLNVVLPALTEELIAIKSFVYLNLQHAPHVATVVDAAFSMLPRALLCSMLPLTSFCSIMHSFQSRFKDAANYAFAQNQFNI